MIHGIDEREQLARLHDRHKRLSLEAFDSVNNELDKDLIEQKLKELKETSMELDILMKKFHSTRS